MSKMRVRARIVWVMLSLFGWLSGEAQHALEPYGKNRIQYKAFEWQYLSSSNFDVYFYGPRRDVAAKSLQFLDSEFDRITDLIGYPPYLKTKVFLYNSVTDLQQSNVGLNQTNFTPGGETSFIKPYVEIAHPGTVDEFKDELLLKVAELMINEMMFGGSLKEMFQNAVLMNLPSWFVDGAIQYVARGWTAEMDDYMRQLLATRDIRRATRLPGPEAALVGHSIWNFIAERYGKSSIANILNYTRVIRSEQKSVMITLGISFKQLLTEWQAFYGEMADRVGQSYVIPPDSLRFSPHIRRTSRFTTLKLSPDGQKVAYAENDRGRFTVKVKAIDSRRELTVVSGGNRVIGQEVDYNIPLISWADANTLGVIGVHQGEYVFWLYDLVTRTKVPRELDRFSNVRNFDFNGNGRLAVISADFEGQNDLFLISTRRDRTRRLTNDLYDDLDPTFVPNTNTIVFSSNRATDTTNTKVPGYLEVPANLNLYLYNLDTMQNRVTRLTNTLSRDFQPVALDENNIFYLSDQRGIVNLFRFNRQTSIYNQVTNFAAGIRDFDLDFENRSLAIVTTVDRTQAIFIDKQFNYDRQVFTPTTRRREVQQTRFLSDRKKAEPQKGMTIKDLINARMKESIQSRDTVRQEPPEELPTGSVRVDTVISARADTVINLGADKPINTDDYKFDDEVVKPAQTPPTESLLSRYLKSAERNRMTGPFPYEAKFSADNMVTSFVIDPLRGFGILLQGQMNDILENYRIHGGLMTAIDLRSSDAFVEAQYLPQLIDLSARYERKTIFWDAYDDLQRYYLNKLEVGAALPLNVRTRLNLKPFLAFTKQHDLGDANLPASPPTYLPSEDQFYGGVKVETVFDQSVATGLNIIEGTRAKVMFQHYEAFGNNAKSFSQAMIDVRHYQKVYKEIVLALRGYSGTFFGNSPQYYLLGGMDNWFNNTLNYEGSRNPLGIESGYNPYLIFAEFSTGLRGFDYAVQYGNSVAHASAELRVPIVRALASGPIASNFFRNMQMTAFYDIGTAWSGEPPFSSESSTSSDVIQQGPFQIEIKNYINPWIYSYGVGFRTLMLGYYLKFDLAWPVSNYVRQDPRLFVSIGFDF